MIRRTLFPIALAGFFALPGVVGAQVGAPRRGGAANARSDSATASEVKTVPLNPKDTVTHTTLVCADSTVPARQDRTACDQHGGTRTTIYTHTTNSANLQPTTGASAATTDSAAGRPTSRDSAVTDSAVAAADSLAAAAAAAPPKGRPPKGDDDCDSDKSDKSGQQKRTCHQQERNGRPQ
jgi:hypothetical protein